jgi:hypothetical protein
LSCILEGQKENKMKRNETTVYDHVKRILIERAECRNSDKALAWRVWSETGVISSDRGIEYITKDGFLMSASLESIGRARRMVQSDCPMLRGTNLEGKRKKYETKGTFVYRESARTGLMQ